MSAENADLKISLGDNFGYYRVVERDENNIHISPVDDPETFNQLVRNSDKLVDEWTVYDSDEPYEIEFINPETFREDFSRFVNEIAGDADIVIRRSLSFTKSDITLEYINSSGRWVDLPSPEILGNPEESVEWFKYHYGLRGKKFLQEYYRLLTDPLAEFRNKITIDFIDQSHFRQWFHSSDEFVVENSPFPSPPVKEWTHLQRRALAAALHPPVGRLARQIVRELPNLSQKFVSEYGLESALELDMNLWFVHFFDLEGVEFIRKVQPVVFNHYSHLQGPLREIIDQLFNQ